MSLFAELKRRNVFRVGIAYVLMGWVLLQGVDFALDLVNAPNWVMQVFFIAVFVGLPIALFFAWAFELTPEGIKREADVDRSQSIAPRTGRKLDRLIIAFLALVIVVMGAERLYNRAPDPGARSATSGADSGDRGAALETDPPAASKSIAVLPFADLSQAGDQEWFADGLAEEILNVLTRIPDLQVSARTSSFRYKGSDLDIPQIAAELGVAHVLEGSVRSSGSRIRVTAQLIRAEDGFHVWSENYDRQEDDMIGIQEDLARSIATALETTMDPAALADMSRSGTRSVEAYREFLRGLALQSQLFLGGSTASSLDSYQAFERARDIDPGFARAHFMAAQFWERQLSPNRTDTGLTDLTPVEMLAEFQERIGLAIDAAPSEIDRTLFQAFQAQVGLQLRESVRLYRDYIAQRPNDSQARSSLFDVAAMASEKALQTELLDYWRQHPGDPGAASDYINNAYRVIDPSEGADFGLQALQRWPTASGLLYQVHRTLLWAGRNDEAREIAVRYYDAYPDGSPLVALRQACADGDRTEAERRFAEIGEQMGDAFNVRWLALQLLEPEQAAIDWLRPLEASGVPYQLASELIYSQFDPRPYPSLMAVLKREGVNRPPPRDIPFRCPPPEQPSIAVLPFVNMSADADNEYFSDGVSEEILNVLTGIENLKVTARTSAFSYKGSKLKIDEIARELGVNHILEGSVRKSGDQVRVTAQLIQADGGFHLWSETYDRQLDNIFAIQDEIAGEIAAALKVTLELEPEQENFTGTSNTQAYEAFLRGVNLWHLRTGRALQDALQQFDTAIAIDPGFARAHAYQAMTWAVISDYTEIPRSVSRPKARQSTQAAMALDPDSFEAASVMILTAEDLDQKMAAAQRALALNPGFATAHQWSAGPLQTAGELEAARVAFQRALELDPRSRVTHQNLVALYINLEQWDEARRLAENALSFAPDLWPVAEQLFTIALFQGKREEAAARGHELARKLGRRRDTTDRYLALYFEPENRAEALAEIMDFPLEDFDSPDNPSLLDYWNLPETLARAGAVTETLELLRWLRQNKSYTSWLFLRNARGIEGVLCHPNVQAFYAEADVPPMANPPDCAGG